MSLGFGFVADFAVADDLGDYFLHSREVIVLSYPSDSSGDSPMAVGLGFVDVSHKVFLLVLDDVCFVLVPGAFVIVNLDMPRLLFRVQRVCCSPLPVFFGVL